MVAEEYGAHQGVAQEEHHHPPGSVSVKLLLEEDGVCVAQQVASAFNLHQDLIN